MGCSASIQPQDSISDKLNAGFITEGCEELWSRVVDEPRYEAVRDLCKDWDITNLVFEGGGTKGVAYAGAAKALLDLGVLHKVRRFAGASAGSYVAMKLCMYLDPARGVEEVLLGGLLDLRSAIYDSTQLRLPFNIMYKLGWHSGDKLLADIRNHVKAGSGDPDTTFQQWYERTGREFCVVVSNLSTGNVEYCHPKTTPNMSIALAVKTSMCLPLLFQPSQITYPDGASMYCDGGLLDNFPIHAFDGWYLSMELQDSFFHRFDEMDKPFGGEADPKTLGLLLFNAEETENFEEVYTGRYLDELEGERPDTKLARAKADILTEKLEKKKKISRLVRSSSIFLKQLCEYNLDKDDQISREEFKKAFESMLSDARMAKHIRNIFGEDFDHDRIDEIFTISDLDKNHLLSFNECLHMLQNAGAPYRQLLHTVSPSTIASVPDYIQSILSAMQYRVRAISEARGDADRTIGIYTDYVGTADFDMETGDKVYVIKQGWKAVMTYLEDKIRTMQGRRFTIFDPTMPTKL